MRSVCSRYGMFSKRSQTIYRHLFHTKINETSKLSVNLASLEPGGWLALAGFDTPSMSDLASINSIGFFLWKIFGIISRHLSPRISRHDSPRDGWKRGRGRSTGASQVSRMDYRGGKSIRSVKFPSKVVIKDQRARRLFGQLLEYVRGS